MEGRRGDTAPGTEGARRASGVPGAPAAGPVGGPVRTDPEVPEKAQRRRFSEEYKLRIVEAADRCRNPGEVGALLRREGLYSSLLSIWRQQRRDGALDALRSRKRGPKPRRSAESWQIEQLERENVRLREELRKAEVIIEVQKKVSRLLSNLETDDDNGGRI